MRKGLVFTQALEIKELTKRYRDFTLDRVSITLPMGAIMGLIGENGAGKSTMIKLILGMIKRGGGEISVLGRDNREHFNDTKEDIGVVLDEACFPDCVTAKSLDVIMRSAFKRWDSSAFWSNIERFDLPRGKKFREFSRGMKMKLSLAAALSHGAKLLILDEATSGLDPVARDELLDILKEFTGGEGRSILISSHIVSDLEKICDYIAFISRGRLMLCEEKDRILREYAMINLTPEQFANIDKSILIGHKTTDMGVRALVERGRIPAGTDQSQLSPMGIEDIFVFMSRA